MKLLRYCIIYKVKSKNSKLKNQVSDCEQIDRGNF